MISEFIGTQRQRAALHLSTVSDVMRRQVQLTAANQLAALRALIGTGQLQRPALHAQQMALLIEIAGGQP